MSWHSAPVSEDWNSASVWLPEEGLAPYVMSNGTPTPRASSWRGWKTRRWSMRLFGTTSPRSMLDRGVASWIASLRDSHVSHGPLQGGEEEPLMNGGSGPRSLESSANVSPASSSSRTSLDSTDMAFVRCFPTLPRSGSMRNGRVFERAMSERRIDESGFSCWPTATTMDANSSARHTTTAEAMHGGTTLTDAIRAWPTSTQPYGTNQGGGMGREGPMRPSLDMLASQWLSPNAHDGRRPEDPHSTQGANLARDATAWATPTARDVKGQDILGRNGSPSLPHQVMQVAGETTSQRAVLNPRFVEALMGLPIGWTVCGVSATPSCRSKQHSHSESLENEP